MKRMILTLDVEIAGQDPEADDFEEADTELVEQLLDDKGFAVAVETDEGTLTLLPTNTYYGEFDDDVTASSLSDAIEEAFTANGLEIASLLLTEMGRDQVLVGAEVDADEDVEA